MVTKTPTPVPAPMMWGKCHQALYGSGSKHPIQPPPALAMADRFLNFLFLFLRVPQVSPLKWQSEGIPRMKCALFPRDREKRGNFRDDGCWRWRPIRFGSLKFTTSAALCKQLGSKTGCSAISRSPFHFSLSVFFPPTSSFCFLCTRSAVSLRKCTTLDFSREILNYRALPIVWMPILLFFCCFFLHAHLSQVTEQNCCAKCWWRGTIVACISKQRLRILLQQVLNG